jgi:hypothetical protein
MPIVTLPRKASHTIALDSHGHINSLVGLCGRILLGDGEDTWRVIEVMQAARAAAQTSDEDAISVLEAAGFQFIKHYRGYQ